MNVINQKVPTLLGLEAMTKMKTQINIAEQTMEINGSTREIKVNKTGRLVWDNVNINKERLANEKEKIQAIFAATHTNDIE